MISLPGKSLAQLRPRIIATQDFPRRISAAGLISLKSFMAQRAFYVSDRSAESVHQMRVAIRRLRTVLYVLYKATSQMRLRDADQQIKEFAQILGQGRDQDVFFDMLANIPTSFHHSLESRDATIEAILKIREARYRDIDAALQNPKFDSVIALLISLFQTRDIQVQQSIRGDISIDAVLLNDLYNTVLTRGRKLGGRNLEERHHLRIALKRLYYALEFLGLDHCEPENADLMKKSIKRLLDHLGAANDAYTASRLAFESLAQTDGHVHVIAGLVAGWYGRSIQDHESDLLEAWRKFKSTRLFWNKTTLPPSHLPLPEAG